MSKKETIKFVVQLIASIASAILTALAPHRALARKTETEACINLQASFP